MKQAEDAPAIEGRRQNLARRAKPILELGLIVAVNFFQSFFKYNFLIVSISYSHVIDFWFDKLLVDNKLKNNFAAEHNNGYEK